MSSDEQNDETNSAPPPAGWFRYFLLAVNIIYGMIGALEAWFERDNPRRLTVGLIMAGIGLLTVALLLYQWRKR